MPLYTSYICDLLINPNDVKQKAPHSRGTSVRVDTDKPHSVTSKTQESSIWDVRYRTPQAVYPMLFAGRVAPMHLFHLAPDGVCLATDITADAGALLPHRFTLTSDGCNLFSVALAVRLPRPDVIRHRTLWSADFPRRTHDPPRFPDQPGKFIILCPCKTVIGNDSG